MKRILALLLILCLLPFSGLAQDQVFDTVDEAAAYITSCRESGITSFEFVLSKDAFNAVKADLEGFYASVGIRTADLRTLSAKGRMTFSNVVYGESIVVLNSIDEVMAYVKSHLGQSTIELYLSDKMFSYFSQGLSEYVIIPDVMMPIAELTFLNGILDFRLFILKSKQLLTLSDIKLYPGTEILQAIAGGTEDQLSSRLKETLQAARKLAADCKRDTDLETARAIHDWLCEKNRYENVDGTDEDDTAVGAILNGIANCDGYSDAFLLIGTLAGLEVRYQHGDSQPTWMESLFSTDSHMWNLLKLDGTWRMVDVTWDDQSYGIVYNWFNIGEDRASTTHEWRHETTVEMLQQTDLASRPENEYIVHSADEACEAASLAVSRGQELFFLYAAEQEDAYKACMTAVRSISCRGYNWNNKMNVMTVITK